MNTTYAIKDMDLLLDVEGERKYVLKIKDLPSEDKPRERLIKYGPAILSTSELLTV